MQRKRLLIPDALYQRLQDFCTLNELGIAEAIRRAIEAYLDAMESKNVRKP